MWLWLEKDTASFGLRVQLERFPDLMREHSNENPSTADLEIFGAALLRGGFPSSDTVEFVKRVCGWGGYPGIWGRVLDGNRVESICSALSSAKIALENNDVVLALRNVNALRGLGEPSFASKHLRFLKPEICPVFDSILRDALPYSYDPDGYGDFASDCVLIANRLEGMQIKNPIRSDGRWFCADVESSLYMMVRRIRNRVSTAASR